MEHERNKDNQSDISAANKEMVKQDDDDDVNHEHGPIPDENKNTLNPLIMTEVLSTILNLLDIINLKKSRLVCKLWRFEGGKILLKKSNVRLEPFAKAYGEENSEEIEQLENFLNTKGASATFNSTIERIKNPNRLFNVLPLLLERTSSLSLNWCHSRGEWRSLDNKLLDDFLQYFPNLKILHLDGSWAKLENDFTDDTKMSLLKKLEALTEIRLKYKEGRKSSPLTNLLLTKTQVAVKEFYLSLGRNRSTLEKYLESEWKWPVDTLFLDTTKCKSLLDYLPFVQAFLEKISISLRHVTWAVQSRYFPVPDEYLIPWANNWVIPPNLNGLESLKIDFCWPISYFDFVWLSYTCALQLPNLKKLCINYVLEDLEDKILEWNEHPDAKGRTLKSESLEELEIIQKPDEIQAGSLIVFSRRRLWPNLKSLYIQNPPQSLATFFLLSEWIGLERLELKFDYLLPKEADLWSKWFTGRGESKDGNDSTCFALNDLKSLKHLGFLESEIGGSSSIVTDCFAENCLKLMTQLQSLHLQHSKISEKGKEMLKETLGPTVNIIFEPDLAQSLELGLVKKWLLYK